MKSIGFLLTILLFWFKPVGDDWKSKVDDHLIEALQQNENVEILILLNKQADISAADHLSSKEEKGDFVFKTLQTNAHASQKQIQHFLQQKGIPFKAFYIINAIYTKGNQKFVQILAERAEVKEIQLNPWSYFEEATLENDAIQTRDGIEWGVQQINAPEIWDAGFKGKKVIIGGQDTGFDWEHPALRNKYLG